MADPILSGRPRSRRYNSIFNRLWDIPHVSPTPELRAVLECQRDLTEALQRKQGGIIPWIFHRRGEPIRQIEKNWNKATDAARLKGLIPHACGARPCETSSAPGCPAPQR